MVGGSSHQYVRDILQGGGTIRANFRIGDMGHTPTQWQANGDLLPWSGTPDDICVRAHMGAVGTPLCLR